MAQMRDDDFEAGVISTRCDQSRARLYDIFMHTRAAPMHG